MEADILGGEARAFGVLQHLPGVRVAGEAVIRPALDLAPEAIAREDLLRDSRFEAMWQRVKHRTALVSILSEIFVRRGRDEWIALLEASDIPACRVNDFEEVMELPQVIENGMVVAIPHSSGETLRTLGPPVKLSGSRSSVERLAPVLGGDPEDVLREYGLSAAEVAALGERRII